MPRRLPSWIVGFEEYTKLIYSPRRFRVWTAISVIAGALGRQVKVPYGGQFQFPNMYTIFIAPAALGKSNAIKFATPLVDAVDSIYLAPGRIASRQAFYEQIEKAGEANMRLAAGPGSELITEAALYAIITEMNVFLHEGDHDFFADLSDIYDNNPRMNFYAKQAKSSNAEKPCVNLLLGATPDMFRRTFPEATFEAGLPSRFMLIWADTTTPRDPFAPVQEHPKLKADLIHDLEAISMLRHTYQWTPEAMDFIRAWNQAGNEPKPDDPRLAAYCRRRVPAHFVKLCMVLAADSGDTPIITYEHALLAKQTLEEAEEDIHQCIGGAGRNPYYPQMKTAARTVAAMSRASEGRPVPDHKIRAKMQQEVSPTVIKSFMDGLRQSGWVVVIGDKEPYSYLPNYATASEWRKV